MAEGYGIELRKDDMTLEKYKLIVVVVYSTTCKQMNYLIHRCTNNFLSILSAKSSRNTKVNTLIPNVTTKMTREFKNDIVNWFDQQC